uniref:UDP-N-acetylmuramoyl-L-alanyl-D-glutamatesynthetase n=1 Tax=Paulinella chromatophora TaxID=39717 RepID=B1X595_PAUCH|nr:UDP-N-acetylmuramoyl-L-alanyl-D-glutamatesynthetase [Paulinella chromatophora]ACB43114.1 UDP-N-acetylmuramoyl-L-alanyl-D-glutamatesynthetase [Paulinella chromatophora]
MVFTVVLGLGKSGIGAARLLISQKQSVIVIEERKNLHLEELSKKLREEGIEVRLGTALRISAFEEFFPLKRIIVSPGIPWDHPTLNNLRQNCFPLMGEMVLAWEVLGKIPWIAITGTNGKTTVTHLVNHLLSYAGLEAPMCGNIGFSATDLALSLSKKKINIPDWLIVELSSYQIESAPVIRPNIVLWTTLTPDHLERHNTLFNYRSIKSSLVENSNYQILNADDLDLSSSAGSWPNANWVSTDLQFALSKNIKPVLWIADGYVTNQDGPIFSADGFNLVGVHNQQNLLMAAAVGLKISLSPKIISEAFRCFPGVPHRLDLIRSYKGIHFYNDSKATNYDAAEVAIKAVEGPIIVLAGGQTKKGEANGWISQLKAKAKAVVLFGQDKEQLKSLLQSSNYIGGIHCCSSLKEAVPLSLQLAIKHSCCSVLFSPACASFDQYSDFVARGNHFCQEVETL